MRKSVLLLLFPMFISAQVDPYKKIGVLEEKLEVLPVGAVLPKGWIASQIRENLDGFTGHLDSLAPDLIVSDDIFVKNRLSRSVKSKDVGAIGGEGDWQVQFLWWNSETQGNWRDGQVRSAILSGDKKQLRKAQDWVARIMASQDEDGYIGIYDRDLRYRFDNENGELWAKTTVLRNLLAWYDYSHDQNVLNSVKRAVENTMQGFPEGASRPFYSVNENVGGLSHGLMFTDVLEELHRLTKDERYLDYSLFLYRDFSENKLNEDAQYAKLMNPNLALKGHGVHTYEHLRALAAAWTASGNPELKKAIDAFESKIEGTTTPTGGPVGDEWIGGKKADATTRGYEYCSVHELLHSYESLLAKTADAAYADKVENLFFNAAQGARHPEKSCIAYLKSDNSYAMTGGLNGDESDAKQTRYRYSPVHKEAAVCCVPNAGRIAPYYVRQMWMKGVNSLVAALLGPSEVTTDVNGKTVSVKEETDYPFGNVITFKVSAGTDFELWIRRPLWAKTVEISQAHSEKSGFFVIPLKAGKSSVKVTFSPEIVEKSDVNGEHYFTFGPLVLAHPIESKPSVTKEYPLKPFADMEYEAVGHSVYQLKGSAKVHRKKGLKFEMTAFDPQSGKETNIQLVPMGQTVLRQVTFGLAK